MRAASPDPTTTTRMRRRRARSLLAVATALVAVAALAAVPAAFADTGTPVNGSVDVTIVPLDPNDPSGPVTVYARGQWNWMTHKSDCNEDRAGAGLSMIWNDPNEPGYPLSGKDVNGQNITYGVGVAKILNGDPYNEIDGTVHPVDLGIEGGANAPQAGDTGQVFNDVAPVPSGKPQDYKNWRGGCGREPLDADPYAGHPYGSWGYDPAVNGGLGYSHVYMRRADVTTVCVNMYDVHGGGKPGTKTFQLPKGSNEIDAAKAGDNTIKAGQFDPVGLNCVTPVPDLAITKTDGVDSVVPGTTTTYTVTVTNVGSDTAIDQTVSDPVPAGVTAQSWTATASGGSTVSPSAGSDALSATVTIPAGDSVTFTVTAQVSPGALGQLVNTAGVTAPDGDPDTTNNTATDVDTLTPVADLAVTKTDGVSSVGAGGSTTYTVVVSNNGPSSAAGVVTDPLPAGVASAAWTAVTSSGASVADTSGSGGISEAVTLAPGATVTFTVVAQISPSAAGTVTNTATAAVTGSATDPNSANDSATDVDTVATVGPDLKVTKDDGVYVIDLGTTTSTTYTIVVTNLSGATASGATLTDVMPANVATMTWSASVSGGASVSSSSGSGSISVTATIPVGGTVTFTATVTGIDNATSDTLDNTATASVAGDTDTSNNQATDSDFLSGF